MKTFLKVIDGTQLKDKIVNLLAFIKFDFYFAIIKLINKLPLPSSLKWNIIVKLRKAAK